MFERRLKIFLIFLLVISFALAMRAAQIQWIQHAHWVQSASDTLKQSQLIETTRGEILDCKGAVLAEDVPCLDACVDYRVITEEPDPKWLAAHAVENLQKRLGDQYLSVRHSGNWRRVENAEIDKIRGDLDLMWSELARVSDKSPEEISEIRQSIVTEVESRRRYLWWRRYKSPATRAEQESTPAWYQQFLGDSGDDNEVDKFEMDVGEQRTPHVILPDIDQEIHAQLAEHIDRFPALSFQASKKRFYPFAEVGSHILGWLDQVRPSEMEEKDPFRLQELRRYTRNDLIGRSGIEALCETTLRGAKGRIEQDASTDQIVSSLDPVPGKNVQLTIDIELQQQIQDAFVVKHDYVDPNDHSVETRWDQHGAAVVIDVASGKVLALVSNPGFDPDTIGTEYAKLVLDDLNGPLIDRATQMALPPGSTAKTIVGNGAIADGKATDSSTTECTGYLVLRGRTYSVGRCWEATNYASTGRSVAHHPDPVPHPTGFLTISDGLERSCNVVFETLADRMGGKRLHYWFDQFGLGRPTGIGIEEAAGRIPRPVNFPATSPLFLNTCFAGIGQVDVEATPLQMANVAATIARRGVWVRPQLVAPEDIGRATTKPSAPMGPDRVDLHLPAEAINAVQLGMLEVVNETAGTGRGILPTSDDEPLSRIKIAGKTGSAQTTLMSIPNRDAAGHQIKIDGVYQRHHVELGTPGTEGWYRAVGPSQHMVHAWYIGYAPADHPQVAFCVMVQYGESGGIIAGSIAHDVLAACINHGYLSAGPLTTAEKN